MGIKTANITDASNIPTNEVIGILEKIKFHTTLAYSLKYTYCSKRSI